MIYLKDVKGCGKGVFTDKFISRGSLIVENPVIPYTYSKIEKSELKDYSMAWSNKHDCLAMGLINFMNHSEKPNIYLKRFKKYGTIRAYAKRNIQYGEELRFHLMRAETPTSLVWGR